MFKFSRTSLKKACRLGGTVRDHINLEFGDESPRFVFRRRRPYENSRLKTQTKAWGSIRIHCRPVKLCKSISHKTTLQWGVRFIRFMVLLRSALYASLCYNTHTHMTHTILYRYWRYEKMKKTKKIIAGTLLLTGRCVRSRLGRRTICVRYDGSWPMYTVGIYGIVYWCGIHFGI